MPVKRETLIRQRPRSSVIPGSSGLDRLAMEHVSHTNLVAELPERLQALLVQLRPALEVTRDEDQATQGAKCSRLDVERELAGCLDKIREPARALLRVVGDPRSRGRT